jgi:hypothetical protein
MARYYCTCRLGERVPHDYQHTQYHETDVDEEGTCNYCGYYAFSRASIQHELFPRHGRKVTAQYVYKNINSWKDPELYHQFFHGYGSLRQGLNSATLKKDQEKISNEREQLERLNRNRG